MADRMRIAAVLAHEFAGAVLSTGLAMALLEPHPTQLVRRGGAWETYLARWGLAYCTVSHHHFLRNVSHISLFHAVTYVTKLSGKCWTV